MRITLAILLSCTCFANNCQAQATRGTAALQEPAYWWPLSLLLIFLLLLFIFALRKKNKQLLQEKAKIQTLEMGSAAEYKHRLEMEKIVNFFTHSIYNHHSKEALLWDLAKNCISKLGFEDCVIYLVNPAKKVLVQMAACGPKTTEENKIINPIEIPLGTGIVGSVALSGKAEIINDTTADARYIVDDIHRNAELTVPIFRQAEVMGIIDCEHSQKNFYTVHHLQLMETIAVLCADRLEKIAAEDALRLKEQQLLDVKQNLAFSQLTALRSQMNPHFIFNALNSVQQFILEGDVDKANRHLTRFSRLQREILQHCDQQFISLEKEIEMLQLYLHFEQLRFLDGFQYQILLSPAIDSSEIKIPPMLLQPFVENAIWHGLMPKNGPKNLQIHFNLVNDSELQCSIEDNGIGLSAAARIQAADKKNHVSKGIHLVKERMQLLEQQYQQPFTVSISELHNEASLVVGTRILLHLFVGH